jgi:hypothetical protein
MSIEAMKQVLSVTQDGEFIWHPDADRLIEKGDYSNLPAMQHILLRLREAEKQEPVAWVDLLKAAEQIVKDKFLYKRFIDGTPLANDIPCWMADFVQQYTHPQPKREPLTDEQIKQILNDCDNGEEDAEYALAFARAIEAAHGITSDMKQEHVAKTAKQRHEENT